MDGRTREYQNIKIQVSASLCRPKLSKVNCPLYEKNGLYLVKAVAFSENIKYVKLPATFMNTFARLQFFQLKSVVKI